MRVFLSASREARPHATPDLIGGFEADLLDGVDRVEFLAPVHGGVASFEPEDEEAPPTEVESVTLVGRPTGRRYRGLPWWELEVEEP